MTGSGDASTRDETRHDPLEVEGFVDFTLLGSGGVGSVYSARRHSTGGLVALKVLREAPGSSSTWRRAQREIAALIVLKGHPNVISIEEMVISNTGSPVLVMELAVRGALSAYVANSKRTLSSGEALLVGCDVAQALTDAHSFGIVHRDIKPHNLLISTFGRVKVCDFGVSSLRNSSEFSDRTSALSIRYASPEEIDDDPNSGPPADVFSLAATLIHLWTGSDPRAWRRDRQTAPPAVGAANDISTAFDQLLLACQDPDPDRRPAANLFLEQTQALISRAGALVPQRIEEVDGPALTRVEQDSGSIEELTVIRPQIRGLARRRDAPLRWWEQEEGH